MVSILKILNLQNIYYHINLHIFWLFNSNSNLEYITNTNLMLYNHNISMCLRYNHMVDIYYLGLQ